MTNLMKEDGIKIGFLLNEVSVGIENDVSCPGARSQFVGRYTDGENIVGHGLGGNTDHAKRSLAINRSSSSQRGSTHYR